MLRLLHFRLCPFSRSIRLLLAELKIDVELTEERPWEWRKEFVALNPAGELPVLILANGHPICGAYAISEYIAEDMALRPRDADPEPIKNPPIFPGDRLARAETRRVVDWFHKKFQLEVTEPLLEEKLLIRLRGNPKQTPDSDILKSVQKNIRYHVSYAAYLTEDRNWLAGEHLSFADFAAAGHISCVDYLGDMDWPADSPLKLWYARMKSRPSLRAILTERIPGAPMPPANYANPDF